MARRKMKLSELPRFPCFIDKLWKDGEESTAEIDGRKMRWVGFGWVDEGEADGTEPLLITLDE